MKRPFLYVVSTIKEIDNFESLMVDLFMDNTEEPLTMSSITGRQDINQRMDTLNSFNSSEIDLLSINKAILPSGIRINPKEGMNIGFAPSINPKEVNMILLQLGHKTKLSFC